MSAGQGYSVSGTSSTSSSTASRADTVSDRPRPSENDVRRFEKLMEKRDGGDQQAAKQGKGEQARLPMEDWERLRLAAQMDGSMMMSASAAQANATPPVTPASPAALDALIARYVEMLAVSEPGAAGDPRMMIKLDASILPQTELFLTKAPEGWVLQANTRSPEALRVLTEFGPALERRFAMRNLGALRLETTMEPSAIQPTTQTGR